MSLREQLNADLREALRANDEVRKIAIRGLLASVHNAEIETRRELDDDGILVVVAREIKQRRDGIEEYRKADRQDLVAKEEGEIAVLSPYLPPQASREDIVQAARTVIERVGASGPRDKGKVMPAVMSELRGRAEGREINQVVTELLAAMA
jgi:uncharacterized protein YqeY